MERSLFELFPDLPWPTSRLKRNLKRSRSTRGSRAARIQGPLPSAHVGRDTLRRIRVMALKGRRELAPTSSVRVALDQIVAIAEAALQS